MAFFIVLLWLGVICAWISFGVVTADILEAERVLEAASERLSGRKDVDLQVFGALYWFGFAVLVSLTSCAAALSSFFGRFDDLTDGLKTERFDNGQKKSEGEYKNGKQEWRWTFWHDNGQKAAEGGYKSGKEEGIWVGWHDNGQRESEGDYKDGERVGRFVAWHENGQKESEGEYKDGERVGRWTYWHENGQKESEGEFKNGKREGAWTYCNEEGSQLFNKSGIYSSGARVSDPPAPLEGRWITFRANGERESEGEYKSGKKEGHWVGWHGNGQKLSEGEYKNGEKEGLWIYRSGGFSLFTPRSGIYKAGKRIAPLPKKK